MPPPGPGLVVRIQNYQPTGTKEAAQFKAEQKSAAYAILARRQEDLAFLDNNRRWRQVKPDPVSRPWTDDYADLVGALRW